MFNWVVLSIGCGFSLRIAAFVAKSDAEIFMNTIVKYHPGLVYQIIQEPS